MLKNNDNKHSKMENKILYTCINCGYPVDQLYKTYTESIIKLKKCVSEFN